MSTGRTQLKKSGPGRKKVYPECIMHGEKVFKWWDGKSTADAPGYDNRERKAKARAEGSRKAKAKPKSDSSLRNEEDGECKSDPEYEPMNQLGGSQRLSAATSAMQEQNDDVYIDESRRSPPAARQAEGTHPPEQQAAPSTGMPGGPQTALGYDPCYGTAQPAPCVGTKRKLEEADVPSPQRPSPADTMEDIMDNIMNNIPPEYYLHPSDAFELFQRQGIDPYCEFYFAPEPGMMS